MKQNGKYKLRFGTDGIRGEANKHPFNKETLFRLGSAISKWCVDKYKNKKIQILIGHDTRESCERIKHDLASGLSIIPVKIIDVEILPTPAILQLMQKNQEINCGIMISASHNQYQDNGIKLFDSINGKIRKLDEEKIIENYNNQKGQFSKDIIKKSGKFEYINCVEKFYNEYKKNILSYFRKNFLSGIKIILDCANGATYKIAPDIFKKLGAEITQISTEPNGININLNCGALHTQKLQKRVVQEKADIGISFDGDGDRVIIVNKNGLLKDGDDILCILTQNTKYKNYDKIIGTIMTNKGLEDYLKKAGKKLIRTKVGDKYIAKKLVLENSIIGGESSGHIILKDYLNTGDGIFVALKTIETALNTDNIYLNSFKKYPQILINVAVKNKKDLTTPSISKIIEDEKNKLLRGRTIVRYSGTENLLRIMVEDIQDKSAKKIAKCLSNKLQNILGT